jgi:hypothetical protein
LFCQALRVVVSRSNGFGIDAKAESFVKTLKTEEISGKSFVDIGNARRRIDDVIAEVYKARSRIMATVLS